MVALAGPRIVRVACDTGNGSYLWHGMVLGCRSWGAVELKVPSCFVPVENFSLARPVCTGNHASRSQHQGADSSAYEPGGGVSLDVGLCLSLRSALGGV